MSNILQQLAQNDTAREQLKAYFKNYLNRVAIEQVFKRGDTAYLADAWDVIEGSFEELDISDKAKSKKPPINHAR